MFRVLLTAYLCLGAVFSPLLCCCALEHRGTTSSSSARTCCSKAEAKNSPRNAHSHHRQGHAQSHRDNHRRSEVELASRVPDPHHPDSCPCDKHLRKFVAVRTHKVDVVRGDDLVFWAHDAFALPGQGVSDASNVVTAISDRFMNGPPAALYGRSLLRAYQILRC